MTENTDFDVAIVGASIAGLHRGDLPRQAGSAGGPGREPRRPELLQGDVHPRLPGQRVAAGPPAGDLGRPPAGGCPREWRQHLEPLRLGLPLPAYTAKIDDYGPGLNIRRQKLDPILREMAAETDGVELMMGQTATSLLREGGRVTGVVVRSREGEERELRARLVVGADGRGSAVAKMAGQKTKTKANNRFVYMAYYRDTPLLTGDSPQLWFLDPDMAYAFPTDDELTMLACVPHKDRIPEFKADPEAAMARMFERVPDGPRLDPDKRVSEVARKLDAPNERRRPPATERPWSATRRSPPTRSGGWDRLGVPVRRVAGGRGRAGARRRGTARPCPAAATRAGTGGRWPGTTASAPRTRTGAGSIRSKSSSSGPLPGTTSSPGASPCSGSAGSSPDSSSPRARSA